MNLILKNKVILITGSTGGIGKAIAEECYHEGAKVIVHGLNSKEAKEAARKIGPQVKYIAIDISSYANCIILIRNATRIYGRIDVLINNAAIYPRNNIININEKILDKIIAINLKAPLFISKEVIKIFKKYKIKGNIINIGSVNAYGGSKDLLAYSISKGGLMTMTRNLANALNESNIRVNCLNIGWTATEAEIKLREEEGFPQGWHRKLPKKYAPTGSILLPSDIARQVVFWASDYSYPITGAVYEVEQYSIIGRNEIDIKF